MAKSIPARWSSLASDREVFLLRSSKLPGAADEVEVLVIERAAGLDDVDALE